MLETKEQKQYLATVLVLIFILSLVSFWSKPNFKYTDTTDYSKKDQSVKDAEVYLAYLKTIKTDPEASKQLFETILTDEEVRSQVVATLGANQPLKILAIDEAKIKTASSNSAEAVNSYLSETVGKVYAFNAQTSDFNKNLFASSAEGVGQLKTDLENLSNQLYQVPVPKDAMQMQKSLLIAFAAYNNLINAAGRFNSGDYSVNDAVWPDVYQAYAAVNESSKNYNNELKNLTGKYKITQIQISNFYAEEKNKSHPSFALVKTANAFLGVGDITITVGDIPRIVMDAIKSGIQSAFLQFMGTMLNKLITQIEKNYVIANFLYYSDALVNGQYAQDYLNKYVSDPTDRTIIKQFLPQVACGKKPQNLDLFFKAKAQTYLTFDPATVDPNDPDYYTKLAKVGTFLASPSGWNLYYQDLATQTQSAAEKAVQNELSSSGLKTPRDISKVSITKSINNIISAERASFSALLQLGIDNSESIISQFVAKLTQNLINQFVFSGVTGNPGGGIGVLKEQSICVDVFQITPVVGISDTPYGQSGSVTQEDAEAIQCSYTNSIDATCTNSIMAFLEKCATAQTQDTKARCSAVANSEYVQTLLSQCGARPAPVICPELQSLVNQVK